MRQIVRLLAVCLALHPASGAVAQSGSVIVPERADDPVTVIVQDTVPLADAAAMLQVFVGPAEACCVGKSPIAGAYHVAGNAVTFAPAFDFVIDQTYTVRSRMAAELTAFTIASGSVAPVPEVVAIYPSGDEIPENTLRFYIQFSTPMSPHMVDDFVTLVDAAGKADTQAFMSFSQELWNESRTQLTVLMDPGRIKRGVAQNLTLGPAMLRGNRYSIVVKEGWPAAKTGQIAPRFEKPFTAADALRRLPDLGLWQFQPPRTRTRDPLLIVFDRPFDQQLAQTAITVLDGNAQQIRGTVFVEGGEQQWRFQPDDPWATSTVRIVVNANFEDVAGNNFNDLLDHKVGTEMPDLSQLTVMIALQEAP